MKISPYLSPCTKLKSKWIRELNIKPDTLNLIKFKVRKSPKLTGTGGNFLNRIPIVQAVIASINKGDWGWTDSSVVKSTDCSFRGPKFNCQQPHGSSQPPVMESDALIWCVLRYVQ